MNTTSTKPVLSYRVVPIGDFWKVALPGDSVPLSVHATKEEAIAQAIAAARREHASSVFVVRDDGSVEREIAA